MRVVRMVCSTCKQEKGKGHTRRCGRTPLYTPVIKELK